MELVILYLGLYVVQAVLIYGMTYAYFEGSYPDTGNRGFAFLMALIGALLPIIGPALVFFLSEWAKYGVRYK